MAKVIRDVLTETVSKHIVNISVYLSIREVRALQDGEELWLAVTDGIGYLDLRDGRMSNICDEQDTIGVPTNYLLKSISHSFTRKTKFHENGKTYNVTVELFTDPRID